MTLWKTAPRYLDLEFDITNVSNSIHKIAKESEEIPIQYAPSRTVGGSLKFHFSCATQWQAPAPCLRNTEAGIRALRAAACPVVQ